jgi:hypothetical protein
MSGLSTAFRWHRALMTVAALMAACTVVALVGFLVDSRTVTGLNVWAKPLKFSLSILIYSVTWAWLIAHLPRWRRTASAAGAVIAVALVVEQLAIVGTAAAGTTSHFNVSNPFSTMVWAVMAVSITVLYLATFVTSIAVVFLPLPDPSLTLAVRAGAAIALLGLGLAYLMTGPTAAQLADYRGIVGAHTVGVPDGGPGLPILGWSTAGGDLRIPHFVGMHALQLLPLFAVALAALGRRVPKLRDELVRTRLVGLGAVTYLAVVALVTVQALSGESIVHPSGPTVVAGWAVAGATAAAAVAVIVWRRGGRVQRRVQAEAGEDRSLPAPPRP